MLRYFKTPFTNFKNLFLSNRIYNPQLTEIVGKWYPNSVILKEQLTCLTARLMKSSAIKVTYWMDYVKSGIPMLN